MEGIDQPTCHLLDKMPRMGKNGTTPPNDASDYLHSHSAPEQNKSQPKRTRLQQIISEINLYHHHNCNQKSSRLHRKRQRQPMEPGKTAMKHKRLFVKHDYHDHANDEDDGNRQKRYSFPFKLHALLKEAAIAETKIARGRQSGDSMESDGNDEHTHATPTTTLPPVLSWQPHGRSFLIREPKLFQNQMMPAYFRQTKLTSFQRQLNIYGFKRVTRGKDKGAYYHEFFLRGKPFLCNCMVRVKVKGTGIKAAGDPSNEPDFYGMPPVVPACADGSVDIGASLAENTGIPSQYRHDGGISDGDTVIVAHTTTREVGGDIQPPQLLTASTSTLLKQHQPLDFVPIIHAPYMLHPPFSSPILYKV